MTSSNIIDRYLVQVQQKLPIFKDMGQILGTTSESLNISNWQQTLLTENLFSPFSVSLKKTHYDHIKEIIKSFYVLRDSKSYLDFLKPQLLEKNLSDPGNKSILMCFDFHILDSGEIKLIEINTNASALLLSYFLYLSKNIPLPEKDFDLSSIQKMILQELSFQGKNGTIPKIAICDENPEKQKMFFEFLLYQELFKSFGWDSQIQDILKMDPINYNFIYNRSTDFYLDNPGLSDLKKSFLEKKICVSPNPFEYLLLADKQRFIDFSSDQFWPKINLEPDTQKLITDCIPKTQELLPENKDQIWEKRKKLFFKPKQSFGAKQAYRGQSISRKFFEELYTPQFLAQEYAPAPELVFQEGDLKAHLKYDLRFYVYNGVTQMAIARLYQGQVTNFQTTMGGLATIQVI